MAWIEYNPNPRRNRVGDFFNVSRTVFIDVPCGCCVTIAVENTSTTAAGVAIPIDVANANIVVERVA